MEPLREIIFFRNYFTDFFDSQSEKVKEKIDYVLYLMTVAKNIPIKFFKKVNGYDGLFEIRIEFEGNIFRIFCCFDEGNIVALFNGFQKKSQKTPKKELDKADNIMKDYFNSKGK